LQYEDSASRLNRQRCRRTNLTKVSFDRHGGASLRYRHSQHQTIFARCQVVSRTVTGTWSRQRRPEDTGRRNLGAVSWRAVTAGPAIEAAMAAQVAHPSSKTIPSHVKLSCHAFQGVRRRAYPRNGLGQVPLWPDRAIAVAAGSAMWRRDWRACAVGVGTSGRMRARAHGASLGLLRGSVAGFLASAIPPVSGGRADFGCCRRGWLKRLRSVRKPFSTPWAGHEPLFDSLRQCLCAGPEPE
jgi:hypothetical protein